jgi:hypothetical protein
MWTNEPPAGGFARDLSYGFIGGHFRAWGCSGTTGVTRRAIGKLLQVILDKPGPQLLDVAALRQVTVGELV